jgi:hypothetical protein
MRAAVVFAVLGVLVGCGITTNEELRAKLENRAKFDLNCQDLKVQPLETSRGFVTSYGVVGCERRATYVLNSSTASWIMNVVDGAPVTSKDASGSP